jgi:hypothetical protein
MKKIISNIVVAALSLVLLDLFISASKIVYPQPLVIDQEKGRVYKANSEFVSFSEGFFVGKTNEFQYLGKGYPPEREKDTLRIAIMGDSFIAGLQLFEEHHFRNLLEKALTEKLGKKVEVLNFGRGGFDFSSMYANYLNFISKYNPDLTIFFLSSNDFKFEPLPLVPYVALENGELKGLSKKRTF